MTKRNIVIPTEEDDREIIAAALADADNPPLTDEELFELRTRRTRGAQKGPTKKRVSMRLDADVVEALKAGGNGWTTRANAILRQGLKLKAGKVYRTKSYTVKKSSGAWELTSRRGASSVHPTKADAMSAAKAKTSAVVSAKSATASALRQNPGKSPKSTAASATVERQNKKRASTGRKG
ncbi:MAG: BrnA antitoxin family protein [Pseudomonadota bacterium]